MRNVLLILILFVSSGCYLESSIQSILPSTLSAVDVVEGNAKNDLSWSFVSGVGIIKYKVYRSTTNGSGYVLLADDLSSTNYSDTTALNGITYYYKIVPYNEIGDGVASLAKAITGSCKDDRLTNTPFAWGDGSPGSPYGICTRAHLINVNTDLAADYKLMTDLDLAAESFGLSVIDGDFTGNFDGNSHAIKNFNLNFDGLSAFVPLGFFSEISGTVSKLTLRDFNLDSFDEIEPVGGMVAYLHGELSDIEIINPVVKMDCIRFGIMAAELTPGAKIARSFVRGFTMTNSHIGFSCTGVRIGGFIGYAEIGSFVSDSGISGTMNMKNAASTYVGGFAGSSGATVTNTFTDINLTATNRVAGFSGVSFGPVSNSYSLGNTTSTAGLASGLFDRVNTGAISKVYSRGNVTAATYASGIASSLTANTISIDNSYASGNINGANAGGLIGEAFAAATISNSFFSGVVTASGSRGGIVGSDSNAGSVFGVYSNNYYDVTKNPINPNGANVSALPGTGSSTSAMTTVPSAIYTGWNFSTIWSQANGSYPSLR